VDGPDVRRIPPDDGVNPAAARSRAGGRLAMGVSDAGARSVARGVRPARSGEKRWFAAKGGCVTALTLLIAAPSLAAQGGGRADISGTVFDQGRAVVPGATVTATNQATNQIRTSITGTDGRFNIPTLVPGTYTVKVELQDSRRPRRRHLPSASARSSRST